MSTYGDSSYDEYDALLDTDPIALRDRCRAAEERLRLVSEALAEFRIYSREVTLLRQDIRKILG